MAFNPFKAIGNAVRGVFSRGSESTTETVEQQPAQQEAPRQEQPQGERSEGESQERRGLFGRVRDLFRRESPKERELAEREQQLAERERQVAERERQVAAPTVKDDVQAAMERDREARQQEADRREAQRQEAIERDRQRAQEREQANRDLLSKYKPVQGLGPKGALGSIYTGGSDDITQRINDAANIEGRRVTVRVLKEDGSWKELFRESGRKSGRGVQASFLADKIDQFGGGDLGMWIGGGCTGLEGSYDDDVLDDAIGFQLVETY